MVSRLGDASLFEIDEEGCTSWTGPSVQSILGVRVLLFKAVC